MTPVQIVSFKAQPSGLFVFADEHGVRYATKNALQASLAKAASEQGFPVRLDSYSGWYYRSLQHIERVEAA